MGVAAVDTCSRRGEVDWSAKRSYRIWKRHTSQECRLSERQAYRVIETTGLEAKLIIADWYPLRGRRFVAAFAVRTRDWRDWARRERRQDSREVRRLAVASVE